MAAMPDELRVTSPTNDRVKELVRLRSRRHRDRSGLFLIEGARETERALQAGVELREAYLCPELFSPQAVEAAERLADRGIPRVELSEPPFRKASLRDGPDGILSVARTWRPRPDALTLGRTPLLLVIDGLEKPGNVGALLRTADAAGVTAVFVTGEGTDVFNPNVIRASMGSVFSRPVIPVATDALTRYLAARKVAVVATSPGAERLYWEVDLTGPTAVVVGSEHAGLEADWLDAAERRVRIPMHGLADSLNAATAGALLLYESLRQRRG